MADSKGSFQLLEATISDIHEAYRSGRLTARQLVQMYLDRIEAYDKKVRPLIPSSHSIPKRSRRRTGLMPPSKRQDSSVRCMASRLSLKIRVT